MAEFNLLEKEKILKEIKPEPGLKKYFAIQYMIFLLFPLFFVFMFVGGFIFLLASLIGGVLFIVVGFFVFFLIWIILAWILGSTAYENHYYWITSERVVIKRGLIGTSITSIPFERVSDTIISRSFLEQLAGITSLHIQSMAGQFSYSFGAYLGGEGNLLAISEPEALQVQIMKLIQLKRKRSGLTM